MDDAGSAHPSLRTWAEASRMALNTLRKHVSAAEAVGWLHIESRHGGRLRRSLNYYRCTVPSSIKLSDKDQEITDALHSAEGDAPEQGTVRTPLTCPVDKSVSPIADTDGKRAAESVSTIADTEPELPTGYALSQPHQPNLYQIRPSEPPNLYQPAGQSVSNSGQSVSTHVDTEVLRSSKREVLKTEGAARELAAPRLPEMGFRTSRPGPRQLSREEQLALIQAKAGKSIDQLAAGVKRAGADTRQHHTDDFQEAHEQSLCSQVP
jgi:hypothetical protein